MNALYTRAAVELLLTTAASPQLDRTKLRVDMVHPDLASAMKAAGLIVQDSRDTSCWLLTPKAHAFVNRVVSEAQAMLTTLSPP